MVSLKFFIKPNLLKFTIRFFCGYGYKAFTEHPIYSHYSMLHIFSAAKKPKITKGVRNISVPRKRELKLECHATGEPAPQYIWYKDNQEIIPASENIEVILHFLVSTI